MTLIQDDAMVRLSESEVRALIRYHADRITSYLTGFWSTKDAALGVQEITPKLNQLSTILYQMAVKQEDKT